MKAQQTALPTRVVYFPGEYDETEPGQLKDIFEGGKCASIFGPVVAWTGWNRTSNKNTTAGGQMWILASSESSLRVVTSVRNKEEEGTQHPVTMRAAP